MNAILIAANSTIALCYFAIALLMLLPTLRVRQKSPLLIATALIFLSCALGHGGHVVMMATERVHHLSPTLLRFQLGVDLATATIAITYLALRRYYSFLVDGPLLLTQTQAQLAQANADLAGLNASLEAQIAERTAALADNEDRFRRLAANVPGMIYQFRLEPDGEAGFSYVSSGCLDLYGIAAEAAEQNANLLIEAIVLEDRASFQETVAHSAQTLETWNWQGRITTVSGQLKWLRGLSRPQRQPNGTTVWDGLLIDITDRKQAEAERQQAQAELSRSYAMLKAKQEAALDGILIVDEHQQVVAYNQRFCRVWQIPDELVQQRDDNKILELVATKPKHQEAFLALVRHLYQHPELTSRDQIELQDGRTLDRYTTGIFSDSGEYYGRVWYFRDITQQKTAEEALRTSQTLLQQKAARLEATLLELQQTQAQLIQTEKMSSLGQLVAGIAHEINNPVNFIHGNLLHANHYIQELLQLLEGYQQHYPTPPAELQTLIESADVDFLKADLPALLASMQMGTNRIRSIVLSLRSFSRLDEAEMKAVDLHEGIESTLLILQNRLKPKNGTAGIEVVKDYGELPLVQCYAGQLNQVFMNVLNNAIDALQTDCPRPPARIWIQTERLTLDRVVIRIADNGPGIPETVQSRIFDPFFTTKPVGQGTGLGLSISYQVVVDRHGGVFKCSSRPDQGTEFWIEIPVVSQPASA